MSQQNHPDPQDGRAEYTEYDDGTGTVAMIHDADNDNAWIRSDHTVPVRETTTTGLYDETRRDPETGIYHARYDVIDSESLSMAVVTVVADIADVDPLEMEPLNDVLDAGSLEQLFIEDAEATFTFHDHEVTVTRDGRIAVRPPNA